MTHPRTKPKTLHAIEANLDKELTKLSKDKSLSRFILADARLSAFGTAFGAAASQLKTFGELFRRIRTEYEGNIHELRKDLEFAYKEKKKLLRELGDLQQGLLDHVDLSSAAAPPQSPNDAGKGGALEQLRQRARYAHAHTKLERMEREKSELEAKISILERKLQDCHERVSEEQEAKEIMYAEYAELQNAFEQYKDAIKEQEDPVVLRLALDQSRRDLSKAHAKLGEYQFEYDSVVPQAVHDAVEQRLAQVAQENMKLASTANRLRQDNRDLLQTVQDITQELEARRFLDKQESLDESVKLGVKKWKLLTAMGKKE